MIFASVVLLGAWFSVQTPQSVTSPYEMEYSRITAQSGVSTAGDYVIFDVAESVGAEEISQSGGDYFIRPLLDFDETSEPALAGRSFIAY